MQRGIKGYLKNGYRDGVYYISGSVLGAFVYDKLKGIKLWLGIKEEKDSNMLGGIELHNELGYNNEEMYFRELELDGVKVVLFGIPDKIDDDVVEELKTVKGCFVSEKKKESAKVQLLLYLYVLDRDRGRVVYVDRDSKAIVYIDDVFRDDEYLKKVVKEFLREVKALP